MRRLPHFGVDKASLPSCFLLSVVSKCFLKACNCSCIKLAPGVPAVMSIYFSKLSQIESEHAITGTTSFQLTCGCFWVLFFRQKKRVANKIRNPLIYKVFGSLRRARTADPVINSHLLYQLSYQGMVKPRIVAVTSPIVKRIGSISVK